MDDGKTFTKRSSYQNSQAKGFILVLKIWDNARFLGTMLCLMMRRVFGYNNVVASLRWTNETFSFVTLICNVLLSKKYVLTQDTHVCHQMILSHSHCYSHAFLACLTLQLQKVIHILFLPFFGFFCARLSCIPVNSKAMNWIAKRMAWFQIYDKQSTFTNTNKHYSSFD